MHAVVVATATASMSACSGRWLRLGEAQELRPEEGRHWSYGSKHVVLGHWEKDTI
jgi:hypothetical protein